MMSTDLKDMQIKVEKLTHSAAMNRSHREERATKLKHCNPREYFAAEVQHFMDVEETTSEEERPKCEQEVQDKLPAEAAETKVETEAEEEENNDEDSGRERLKRHRVEVAGRVWIPEIWGQETLLKDWCDCSAFDRSLVPNGLISARAALVEECRRTSSRTGIVENRFS